MSWISNGTLFSTQCRNKFQKLLAIAVGHVFIIRYLCGVTVITVNPWHTLMRRACSDNRSAVRRTSRRDKSRIHGLRAATEAVGRVRSMTMRRAERVKTPRARRGGHLLRPSMLHRFAGARFDRPVSSHSLPCKSNESLFRPVVVPGQ